METDDRPPEPKLSEKAQVALGDAVRRFDPLDRAILESRLGLHGRRRQPLAQIAASLGVLPVKVRLVDGELTFRLRAVDPALMREYVEFLVTTDRHDGAGNDSSGGGVARRRRGGRRLTAPSGTAEGVAVGGGRRSPAVPDKGALAPILPNLSRTQVLIVDELYGLVSGLAATPRVVANRVGVTEGEVRRVDRMVRRLLKPDAPLASPSGSQQATPQHPGSDAPAQVGTLDRATGRVDEAASSDGL